MARDILIRLSKLTADGRVPANASVRFYPSVLRTDADGIILDDPFEVVMVNGEGTAHDVPTSDLNWAYRVEVRRRGASANNKPIYDTWYVHVPEGTTLINFEDLPRIDPKTMTPVNDPDPAWVDAVASVFNDSISTELDAKVPAKMVEEIDNTSSGFRIALDTAFDEKVEGLEFGPAYLDSYAWVGDGNSFVTGQTTASTTTTAAVSAGATVLPLTSVAGISAGVILIAHGATANQQLLRVASVSGNNVTVTAGLGTALSSGATVSPLWVNAEHLTGAGYNAMAYWLANHADLPDLTGKKVTFLGNSWYDGVGAWANQVKAKYPTATVVNVGIAGNTSAALLSRFDAAVPADSDVVIIDEPGVNDTIYLDQMESLSNLGKLLAKIDGLGAKAVVTGPVPLSTFPAKSKAQAARVPAFLAGDAATALSATTNATSVAIGPGAHQNVPTGTSNTAYGSTAQKALTSGTFNTGVGSRTQEKITTGMQNVAVGAWAQRDATTAIANVSMGTQASMGLTSGYNNVHVGQEAGTSTTGAHSQVFVGRASGLPTGAAQTNGATAIGANAKAGDTTGQGHYATAIGYTATASASGGVAIGTDWLGNGAVADAPNALVLGTALHRTRIPGLPTTAPTAGSGILWNDAGTVKVA